MGGGCVPRAVEERGAFVSVLGQHPRGSKRRQLARLLLQHLDGAGIAGDAEALAGAGQELPRVDAVLQPRVELAVVHEEARPLIHQRCSPQARIASRSARARGLIATFTRGQAGGST